MSRNWLRRSLLAAAFLSSALLAACGSGTIESQLQPTRLVGFGDGFSDVGQAGRSYTVNDGTTNNWTSQLALDFGRSLTPVSAGGKSYAAGNARVNTKPDAAGKTVTLTVKEQVDTFLATDALGSSDLVVIGAGTADIVAEMAKVTAGTQTSDQMVANVRQAGRDLGAQVRRLVQAGARFVVVVGPYNLARSPWAAQIGQGTLLLEASSRFNDEMLVSIVDLGANVLYVDAALHYNLVTAVPANYSLVDAASVSCTSVDAGAGIGTGTGQVNSALCTPSTITAGVAYTTAVFADRVYPTPQAHRLFGDYAYQRIRTRW
ncbi:MAG: SGNH/GDSL hydrolase family protein [Burkholderiales bacterium]|nr:SGNH/GDSL hydrolase family protein [Burkholderiales bacterium]